MRSTFLLITQVLPLVACLFACNRDSQSSNDSSGTQQTTPTGAKNTAAKVEYNAIDRKLFNRIAVQMDLPLFWVEDTNNNNKIDPDEVAALAFYPTEGTWVDGAEFSTAFTDTYRSMARWAQAPAFPLGISVWENRRRQLVIHELNITQPSLVFTDFSKSSRKEKSFVKHMYALAKLIDELNSAQRGLPKLSRRIPKDDPSSHGLFRRNWGPTCVSSENPRTTECTAVPGVKGRFIVGMYPEDVQKDDGFCGRIASLPGGDILLSDLVVVRNDAGQLVPEHFSTAFGSTTRNIYNTLLAAANSLETNQAPLKTCLQATAFAFTEASAEYPWHVLLAPCRVLSITNSDWFFQLGLTDTDWDPCHSKSGFGLVFGKYNPASTRWQRTLGSIRQRLENESAALIGTPYKAISVPVHIVDIIDVIFDAGGFRLELGADVGRTYPSFMVNSREIPVKTIIKSNYYTDPDSVESTREQGASLFDSAWTSDTSASHDAGVLQVLLHEAAHGMGPTMRYRINGQNSSAVFGSSLANTLEELKADAFSMWSVTMLRNMDIIGSTVAEQTYRLSFFRLIRHCATSMYSPDGRPRLHGQAAAVIVGFLMEEGAVTFDPNAMAANGKDRGVFRLHFEKFPAVAEKLLKTVGSIKARGDRVAGEAMVKKYVNGQIIPTRILAERFFRHREATFVYGFAL
ncbi:MAG: hypothetical protein FWD57_02245 [Polyangiaceae bacterium]|nr:hypothetical protein [Polyangiaceae bacterium]